MQLAENNDYAGEVTIQGWETRVGCGWGVVGKGWEGFGSDGR